MVSRLEWTIACRYLRAKKKENIISVIASFSLLGVALGVAALIVVMAVMNGFHTEVSNKMTGFNGDINIYGRFGGIEQYQYITEAIRQNQEVTSAVPMIEGQVMAVANGTASGAMVKGVSLDDLKTKSIVANNITGDFSKFSGPDNIILGSELAAALHVKPGDNVTLVSPKATTTLVGVIPRSKVYHVVGLFQSSMYLYDSTTIFMPLAAAQLFFKFPGVVNNIEVNIKDPNLALEVAQKLSDQLGDTYRITDWQTTNAAYFQVLKTERVVMFLILTLIIIVAAFNIISSLIMLVNEKRHAIAILRTIGATRGTILRIFILCGTMIGFIGTAIGAVLGLSFALNIDKIRQGLEKLTGETLFDPLVYYLYSLPADVHNTDVIKIILMSLSLSLLATIYPAWKAANTDPVEGLRNE